MRRLLVAAALTLTLFGCSPDASAPDGPQAVVASPAPVTLKQAIARLEASGHVAFRRTQVMVGRTLLTASGRASSDGARWEMQMVLKGVGSKGHVEMRSVDYHAWMRMAAWKRPQHGCWLAMNGVLEPMGVTVLGLPELALLKDISAEDTDPVTALVPIDTAVGFALPDIRTRLGKVGPGLRMYVNLDIEDGTLRSVEITGAALIASLQDAHVRVPDQVMYYFNRSTWTIAFKSSQAADTATPRAGSVMSPAAFEAGKGC